MSFEFRPYPDATQQCALCKRFDCSKGDEPWLHLLTIETDGGYTPAIGHNCLRAIFANSAFGKPQVVEKVISPLTDEELEQYNEELCAFVRAQTEKWLKFRKAVTSDGSRTPAGEHDPEHHTRRNTRPRTRTAPTGAQGTD